MLIVKFSQKYFIRFTIFYAFVYLCIQFCILFEYTFLIILYIFDLSTLFSQYEINLICFSITHFDEYTDNSQQTLIKMYLTLYVVKYYDLSVLTAKERTGSILANVNCNKGIFLSSPQKLTLLPENDHIKDIDYEWLLWIIRNDAELRFYSLGIWKTHRIAIMDRDHYECQRCKLNHKFTLVQPNALRQQERAYVHHIAELKKFPWLALHYDNLVTLCHQCHEDVHGRLERYQKEIKPFTNFDASEQW